MGVIKINKLLKIIRRGIIVVCLFILLVSNINSLPESKYYSKNLEEQVKQNKAQVIEVRKTLRIDKDKVEIDRLIISHDEINIRFTVFQNGLGWSFPIDALKAYDDYGNEYQFNSASSSGKIWGEEGIISYSIQAKNVKYIKLKLDWYDRHDEIKIPLMEGK